jgi:riboflavin biosynthesis pyrimidine reductase
VRRLLRWLGWDASRARVAALRAQAEAIEVETDLLRSRNERNDARLEGMNNAREYAMAARVAGDRRTADLWWSVLDALREQWEYADA